MVFLTVRLLIFNATTKASLVNMQLTGLKSGRPASLWTGSV